MQRLRITVCLMAALGLLAQPAYASPLIRDAEIEHTLRLYSDPIFLADGLKPSAINLFIVQEDTLNAYVAGGANMFIYTGLIMQCDTPDMLIGVMAHEAGHIVGGHLARGSEKLKNAQIGSIMTFVLGAAAAAASRRPEAATAVITGGQNAVMRNFLSFTRANEEAADQSALGALDKINVSAAGLVKTFELLQRNERAHGGSPDPYMITHPLSSTRIDHVRNHAENSPIPYGQYPSQLNALHQRMVAKLYGFLNSPERTLARYPRSKNSVAARVARALAYYKMPDLQQATTELDSLLAELPRDPFLHELKGQIFFENNRLKEALASYDMAVKLLPNSPLLLADFGKVELAQNPPLTASAIAHLEKSIALDHDNATAWRQLAGAYGKAGQQQMSALALAEEALLMDDPETAMKQADAALAGLKDGTPAKQRARDIKAFAIERQAAKKKEGN